MLLILNNRTSSKIFDAVFDDLIFYKKVHIKEDGSIPKSITHFLGYYQVIRVD